MSLRIDIVASVRRDFHVVVTQFYARTCGFSNYRVFAEWAWATCRSITMYDWFRDEIDVYRCGGSCRRRSK